MLMDIKLYLTENPYLMMSQVVQGHLKVTDQPRGSRVPVLALLSTVVLGQITSPLGGRSSRVCEKRRLK